MPATDIPATELAAVVRAVRAYAAPQRAHLGRLAAFAFALLIFLHMTAVGAWNLSTTTIAGGSEENRMLITRSLAVVSSLALSSTALAQDAVQWKVEDGGNGHWYQASVFADPGLNWVASREQALLRAADLASLESASEWSFATALVDLSQYSAWIGLYQEPAACEPGCGWTWVSGSPIGESNWAPGEPNNIGGSYGDEDHALLAGFGWNGVGYSGRWVDWPGATTLKARVALFEWSADCNNDGIVDYGQILDGSLEDLDGNGVPDCCQSELGCDPCRADIDRSGAVNGVDLAAVLNNWGTSGGKQPRSDVNADGIVNGADLAEVLNSWGVCP